MGLQRPYPVLLPGDQDEEVILEVPLDRETREWLAKLSKITRDSPAAMVASMLRDIRIDDELTHATFH